MDQSKLIGMISNDVSNANTQPQAALNTAKEVRPLNDFELMIAAGGEVVVIW